MQRAKGILNHMHPVALFAWHMVHNFLITHRAEWIAPEYIKLWLRGLPQVGAALPDALSVTLPASSVPVPAISVPVLACLVRGVRTERCIRDTCLVVG